jgi:hypothetical protein
MRPVQLLALSTTNIVLPEGATITADGMLPVFAAGLLELIVSCPVVKFME